MHMIVLLDEAIHIITGPVLLAEGNYNSPVLVMPSEDIYILPEPALPADTIHIIPGPVLLAEAS